jgi:hypothetical protein
MNATPFLLIMSLAASTLPVAAQEGPIARSSRPVAVRIASDAPNGNATEAAEEGVSADTDSEAVESENRQIR